MRHLNEEELIDVAEGTRPENSAPHLASCERCRQQIADLRAMMSSVEGVEVPEPSPLFWEHLSARVREGIAAAGEEQAAAPAWMSWRFLLPAVALVAVVLATAITLRLPSPSSPDSSPVAPVAKEASLADDAVSLADDPLLSLIADLAGDLDWDAAVEAGLTTRTSTLERVVLEMSEDERLELRRILKEELSARPS